MTDKDVDDLVPGVYVLHWKHGSSIHASVAAVGLDAQGRHWYAPTNWVTVPWYDWGRVREATLLTTQDAEIARMRKNAHDDTPMFLPENPGG
jgi:hypothetical protein